MKILLVCLMLVAASQAVDWANIRPMFRVRPSVRAAPANIRINSREVATKGQFPYLVGVFMDSSYFCGGSLISDTVVLTAAQCVSGFRTWDVHCGAFNISDVSEIGRVIASTTNAQVHEDYGSFFTVNDIAIIKLENAVSGPSIGTVRLPSRSLVGNPFVGETCRVSGWGKNIGGTPGITSEMGFVDLNVITNDECAAYYGNSVVKGTTICAGAVSTCSGNSGGPLVWTESDGIISEVGIVSYGSIEGCESGAPAAFTRVTEFLDWLEANAGVPIRA